MSIAPTMLLVNVQNNEKHCLNSSESVIGRGWLNCNDKRISRYHGLLKVISPNSVKVLSTHQNLMFFRKKNNVEVNQIGQNTEVNLFVGDSFGLLVDEFWFSIQPLDNVNNGVACLNGNVAQQNEDAPTTSVPKRKTSVDSEPDSTNKRVKTEPNEYQENGDPNTTHPIDDTTQMPSTSDASSSSSSMHISPNVNNDETNANQPIKIEPSDSTEGQSQPVIRIKTEPMSQEACADSSTFAPIPFEIKTEVKDEPIDNDNNVASGNQREQRRPCCRYGIRCYRRNPLHRADESHPGDLDYRLPEYPDPPLGAPPCPFLDRCYRRNPRHFQQFSHKVTRPKGKEGYEATVNPPMATNTTTNTATDDNAHDTDESEEDPYATDDDRDTDYQDSSESERD
ncbi:aprataxin and PNK-like factor [Contarinia nasturtii]|uniref:aprataxin and PNK-like factor n=1 Tax=Contarinia nasturtii TaxID=265458 RepID=UPI0012D49C44|nr:aprataxin and PNK-like factor [Contarinia nasturtii]